LQPLFRASQDLVVVDVAVLDKSGNPLLNLERDDFVVTVDDRPRRVQSVRLVLTDPARAEASLGEANPRPARTFVFVVDHRTIRLGEGQQMLEAAARIIDSLPASDRVASWTEGLHELRFNEGREDLKQRIRRSIGSYETLSHNLPGKSEAKGTGMDLGGLLLRDASTLVGALASLEGPKHVILLTGNSSLLSNHLPLITALEGQAAAGRVTIHALAVHDASYRARSEGMRVEESTSDDQSAAYALADATGGLALTPVSADAGFRRLTRELSAVYLLAFEAEESERDSAVHRIEVRVRDGRRAATVRARRSFMIEGRAGITASSSSEAGTSIGPEAAEPVGVEPGSIAARLADYIEAFARDASAMLVEERYVQVLHPIELPGDTPEVEAALAWRDDHRTVNPSGLTRRQLVSDVLLLALPGQGWQTYRDVAEVDGKRTRDASNRLQHLLLSTEGNRLQQVQEIVESSLAHGLGDQTVFSFNSPTLVLSLLRRENHSRFAFARRKDETLDGRPCRVLGFQEIASPTLLSVNEGDFYAYGRVWLDQRDGRVRRTELRFDGGPPAEARITVGYQEVQGASVLLPVTMAERYEGLRGPDGREAVQRGSASYSNHVRFRPSVRTK